MAEPGFRQSDADWLRATVAEYEVPLVQYAARLLGDADRARDVVQDVFLSLCRQPRRCLEHHSRQWLFAVCRNRALDILKKESRMKPLSDAVADRFASREADPRAALEHQEAVGQATAVLNALPENQREVIRLKVQHGLSYREISEVTGLSVSNVGFLLHKGITTLRVRLRSAPAGE
jgi:RNA polymerase sigma factor (sigma-70 family)